MKAPSSFRDVIDLWPTKAALIRVLANVPGVTKKPPVREWYARDRIPEQWFDALIHAAAIHGFEEITYRRLTDIFKAADREPGPR